MTRGSAQLCSLGTKSLWNPDGGRTAVEISCDSDLLLLLLLQDLYRVAPLPPLLPEHTGIPFNSLFLLVVKHSLLPSKGHSANCIPLPLHRGHYFPLKIPGCHIWWVEMAWGSYPAPPPPPLPTLTPPPSHQPDAHLWHVAWFKALKYVWMS